MYGVKGAYRKHRCFEALNYFNQCVQINEFFAQDKKYFPHRYITNQYQWVSPHHDFISAEPGRQELN
jgi:hypothetical protein